MCSRCFIISYYLWSISQPILMFPKTQNQILPLFDNSYCNVSICRLLSSDHCNSVVHAANTSWVPGSQSAGVIYSLQSNANPLCFLWSTLSIQRALRFLVKNNQFLSIINIITLYKASVRSFLTVHVVACTHPVGYNTHQE